MSGESDEMTAQRIMFFGIDVSGTEKPFTCAALEEDGRLALLQACELEEILALLSSTPRAWVAINAPARPNRGLVRERIEGNAPRAGQLRGADMRLAEYELRRRGIHVAATPGHLASCPPWMQAGFMLHQKLQEVGFRPYPASPEAQYQMLETHPHAAFCVLLGRQPLPKPSLEGRLQRQLILHDQGLLIRDPMDFFEEITRHRLRQGILPLEYIYQPEQLDALAAACVAFLASTRPQEVTAIGDKEEGQIILPVRELEDTY